MTNTKKPADTVTSRSSRRVRHSRNQAKTIAPSELRELKISTHKTVRRAITAMLVSAVILLIFNSDGLRSYARDLPGSQIADQIVLSADAWHGLMRGLGTTRLKAMMQRLMEDFRTT